MERVTPLVTLVLHEDAAEALVLQTEDRYEVAHSGAARGTWVLFWWGFDIGPLTDPAFIEKAVQVAQHTEKPAWIGFTPGKGHRWRPVSAAEATVMTGALIARAALPAASGRPPRWRAFPMGSAGGIATMPPPVVGPGAPFVRLADRFRVTLVTALPPAERTALRAWTPPETTPIWIGIARGAVRLHLGGDHAPRGMRRARMLGRAFTRPFWRTMPLVGEEGAIVVDASPAYAYAMTAGLPGMVELRVAVGAALVDIGARCSTASLVRGSNAPAWVDVATLPPGTLPF